MTGRLVGVEEPDEEGSEGLEEFRYSLLVQHKMLHFFHFLLVLNAYSYRQYPSLLIKNVQIGFQGQNI